MIGIGKSDRLLIGSFKPYSVLNVSVPAQEHQSENDEVCRFRSISEHAKIKIRMKTHQGDIEKVIFIPDLGEGGRDVGLEVVPSETELFGPHPEHKYQLLKRDVC